MYQPAAYKNLVATRKIVWKSTKAIVSTGHAKITCPDPIKITERPDVEASYVDLSLTSEDGTRLYEPFNNNIQVLDIDCVTYAYQQKRACPDKPLLIINDANHTKPGGQVEAGEDGPEEELFRRTTYSKSLTIKTFDYKNGQTGVVNPLYPIQRGECIFSDSLRIIKTEEYKPAKGAPHVACLAIIPIHRPEIRYERVNKFFNKEVFLYESDKEKMRDQLKLMFSVAIDKGYKKVVMSPPGYGYHKCPMYDMAELLKEIIPQFDIPEVTICIPKSSADSKEVFDQFNKILFPKKKKKKTKK
jgi:hypothetical protein